MSRGKRLKKIYIEDYLQGNSILIRDVVSGRVLSLPNNKGAEGMLMVDKCVFYCLNVEDNIPLNSTIIWHNDGEYVTLYECVQQGNDDGGFRKLNGHDVRTKN
tara:strand:- start:848 stop:1156 length:309 start_codon:yes stop_codon:yes gene_type:complete